MMSAAGAGRISAHRPPPTLLGGGKPDLIYYWHAARSHTAAISFRLVLRGASSGTATFPFWPGQTFFFVSFCYLYFCFRFVFAPYFILPTNRPTTEPPDILAKLVFCFRILLWCPSTWHLEFGRVGPLAAPRLLCAVRLFAEKRFIYLFMFRKDQQRKKGPPWKYFSARI